MNIIGKIIADKRLVVLILVAALLILGASGYIKLGMYGVTFPVNTVTQSISANDWIGNDINAKARETDEEFNELIIYPEKTGVLVTAWQDGGESVPVTIHGTLHTEDPMLLDWEPREGWYKISINEGGGFSKVILETGGDNAFTDTTYIAEVSGQYGTNPYYTYTDGGFLGLFPASVSKMIPPVVFTLKDPHVGALRVEQITVFKHLWGLLTEIKTTSIDELYLASGAGSITLTNPTTRLIAGVDTARFSVDVGYSGLTQPGTDATGNMWVLSVYDTAGSRVHYEGIVDNKVNRIINYAIPSDAKTGQWTAVLSNQLFDQDDVIFFSISIEDLAKAPDIKPMIFDKPKYALGETVTVTLEGIPNSAGTGVIHGFTVWAKHGADSVDYLSGWEGKYVTTTLENTAVISLNPAKGNTYLEVKVVAYDAPLPDGLFSELITQSVYIQDDMPPPISDDPLPFIIAIIICVSAIVLFFVAPIPLNIRALILVLGILIAVAYVIISYHLFLW